LTAGRLPRRSGWRRLGAFWAFIIVAFAALGGTLQALGPPEPAPATLQRAAQTDAPSHDPLAAPSFGVAAPLPALLEASKAFPTATLPKIGPGGRVSRVVYARPSDPAERRPRIALLITGLGMSVNDTANAIASLPGPISLAFSPYATNTDPMQAACRKAGHEMLVSIPMEPQGYPLSDAGSRSLLTGVAPEQNAHNLEWALSRIQGYVGAVGALDAMRGERFADQTSNLKAVLEELKRRGLLYVDPRPGRTTDLLPSIPGRTVDLVIDDPPARAEIEAKLAGLERIAREKGVALGLAGPLRPVTVERIAAWAKTLGDRGIALVPVSALVDRAATAEADNGETVH